MNLLESEALKEHKRAFPGIRLTPYQQDLMEFEVEDMDAWRATIRFWAGNGYRGESVFKMIEKYHEEIRDRVRNASNASVGKWDGSTADVIEYEACGFCGDDACLKSHADERRAA
jgi:hypothetical protein